MRSKKPQKRTIQPDPVFKSRVAERMINMVMVDGKKSLSRQIVYGAIDKLSEDRKEALKIFEQAVKNVMPAQEVRSRRVGGASYQVPLPVKHERSEALALRWIINAARHKKGRTMVARLHDELKNAFEGIGDSIKKREETHKMAEANRAFAHFARY